MPRILSLCHATAVVACMVVVSPWSGTAMAADNASAAAADGSHACPSWPQVLVRAAAAADAQTVCEGVDRALVFLARAGLASPPNTTIELVQQLPRELGDRALGCYVRETRTIQLLTYETFEAGGRWFQLHRDRDLYRALAAHETAHAVVGCHSEPGRLPVAAHEYVAYVTMFATMDAALREALLAGFPGQGFSSTLQINHINHLVDPNQFAVDAWRHYLGRRNREAWLRSVTNGQVVQEWPADGP